MIIDQPLVTVLLPFYKVEDDFDAAIKSIVAQTFSHWKMLLINNNSDPAGVAIAMKWVNSDPRIHLIHEPRQGVSFALNAGLQACQSPFIARMDADDIARPDRLMQQLEFLQNNPDIDVVSSQTTFHSSIPGSEGFSLFVDWQNSIITPERHALLRFVESPLAHPTIMFRKTLIERFGYYSTENVPEDYEMWLRWMDKGVRFYKMPQPLLVWQDHAGRLTRTHSNYSREAFYKVKCVYLARWIRSQVPVSKKILVCGSSRIGRKRAGMLQELGIDIYGFTDVKKRPNRDVRFVRLPDITDPSEWFLINFIARRGVGQAIREHFSAKGFLEGCDFILAA